MILTFRLATRAVVPAIVALLVDDDLGEDPEGNVCASYQMSRHHRTTHPSDAARTD